MENGEVIINICPIKPAKERYQNSSDSLSAEEDEQIAPVSKLN